jgi:hypothetical protein
MVNRTAAATAGGTVSYTESEVSEAMVAMAKHRTVEGEVGAAMVVVGLSAQRAEKEARIRDDMIRVAHRSGASMRQLAVASGLNRKTIASIVANSPARSDI